MYKVITSATPPNIPTDSCKQARILFLLEKPWKLKSEDKANKNKPENKYRFFIHPKF